MVVSCCLKLPQGQGGKFLMEWTKMDLFILDLLALDI